MIQSSNTDGNTVYKRVATLYDLSLDIQRYEIDLEFKIQGGKIYYVFDENIFEFFVRPFAESHRVARDALAIRERGEAASQPDSVQMQTAMLTGEMLFSGQLPGQSGGRIYLSDWHRWELLTRLNELMAEQGELSLSDESAAKYLEDKDRLLRATQVPLEGEPASDLHLSDDLAELHENAEFELPALLSFWRTRTLASLISSNEAVEPLNQLKRLLATGMQNRLHGLVSVRRPIGGDLLHVTNRARFWTTALRNEISARNVARGTVTRRSKVNFENDGKTLALVEWIAGKLGRKERVVFVTGDAALYDTYRRAFEEDSASRRYDDKQFLLRRPTQYTPLFTTPARSAKLDPHLQLFYSVQQAVEMPIATLGIAAIGSRTLPKEVLFRRNSLTLRPINNGRLGKRSYLNEVWWRFGKAHSEKAIADLESSIDRNERMLNGFSPGLIEQRITPEERSVFASVSDADREIRDLAFKQYITEMVGTLIASAVAMWTPIASKFLRGALVTSLARDRRYVPVAVYASPSRANAIVDVVDFVIASEGIDTKDVVAAADGVLTTNSSFELFLVSSAVALIANEWRMAEHLSEVAINAYSHFASVEDVSITEGCEAFYLCALAKRFRMSQIPVDETGSGFKNARRIFDRIGNLKDRAGRLASGALTEQIAIRAEVEYAGACLFFAIYCLNQLKALEGTKFVQDIQDGYIDAHRKAGDALQKCISTYSSPCFEECQADLHGHGLQIIRAQFLINVAAWVALDPMIRLGSLGSFEHRHDLRTVCRGGLSSVEKSVGQPRTELFQAELLAFKIAEKIDADESRARLQQLAAAEPVFELELDQLWFRQIVEFWAGSQGKQSTHA